MARFFAAYLFLAALLVWTPGARAEPRVATLIGNSAYSAELALPNPASDVRLLEKRLKSLGFDVRVYMDVDSRSLDMRIQEHETRLVGAGPSAVGFFLYSGHATQIDGENYLLGVDFRAAPGEQSRSAPAASVSAGLISQRISEAGNRINFIILDACRSDPTGRNGGGSGLARMDAPRGALLAYSTGAGQTASDGKGANSPYAQALDAALGETGLTAEQVFRRTRDRVAALTGGVQTPYESSALVGEDFYFNGGKIDQAEAARRRAEDEKALWATVGDSNIVSMLQTYLATYPTGSYAGMAHRKIAEIESGEDTARQLRMLGEQQPRAGVSIPGQAITTRQAGDSVFALDSRRLVSTDKNLGVNLGVILEGVRDSGAFRARVREVSEQSPFFGKLTVGDEITRINRQPVEEASLAYVLEEAFNQARRVDLTVKRGAAPYAFSYVEPKRMGN